MHKTTGMFFLLLCSMNAIAGPVYRCTGPGGELRYTDRSCAGRGGQLEESALQPNLMTSASLAAEPDTPAATKRGTEAAPRKRGDCDNAADLRHIDLMMKSLASDKRQRAFLKAERKRVVNCELENLPPGERQQRDAALRRTGSLRDSERDAAKDEIEGLYAAQRPAKRSKKR